MSAENLWKSHLRLVENNRQFVDCQLLDEVIGEPIRHKADEMEKVISEMLQGTGMVARDLIRKILVKRSKSVFIPARIMQLILFRGFKKMPWNETRKRLVEHFFPKCMLPYIEPYNAIQPVSAEFPASAESSASVESPVSAEFLASTESPVSAEFLASSESSAPEQAPMKQAIVKQRGNKRNQRAVLIARAVVPRSTNTTVGRYITQWQKPGGSVKFWRQVFWFLQLNNIKFDGLLQHVQENAKSQHRSNRPNLAKKIIFGLLSNRGSNAVFAGHLSIAFRTGNQDDVIDTVRKHLSVIGLNGNIVPSVRIIQNSTAEFVRHFITLFKPERTFSGFRVDLVISVRITAFLIYGVKSIEGIGVDLWGDGCEIGGTEVTRMTFRLFKKGLVKGTQSNGGTRRVGRAPKLAMPTAQSSDAVFCFAGKLNRYVLI